ncbi:MAG: hypothetical protein HY541_05145 [Deltaproteobacteria bacterium]|nr:hypothetical protein [Deltaproteobacteria bacterium]
MEAILHSRLNDDEFKNLLVLLHEYNFYPRTSDECEMILRVYKNELPAIPAFQRLYRELHEQYDWPFHPRLFLDLFDAAFLQFQLEIAYDGLRVTLGGESAITEENAADKFDEQVENLITGFLQSLKNSAIASFLKNYKGLSGEAPQGRMDFDLILKNKNMLPVDDRAFEKLNRHKGRLQRIFGPLYSDNKTAIHLLFLTDPGSLATYRETGRAGAIKTGQVFSKETFEYLQGGVPDDFYPFLSWLGREFNHEIDLNTCKYLLKDWQGHPGLIYDGALATDIKQWAVELQVTVNPELIFRYLWNEKEKETWQALTALYPLRMTDDNYVENKDAVTDLLDPKWAPHLQILLDPHLAPLITALADAKTGNVGTKENTGPSLISLFESTALLKSIDDDKAALVILGDLHKMGVVMKSFDLKIYSPSIRALLLQMTNEPSMLKELEALITGYRLRGRIDLPGIIEFFRLPADNRKILLDPQSIDSFNSWMDPLHTQFAYQLQYSDLLKWYSTGYDERLRGLLLSLLTDPEGGRFTQEMMGILEISSADINIILIMVEVYQQYRNGRDWPQTLWGLKKLAPETGHFSRHSFDLSDAQFKTLNDDRFQSFVKELPFEGTLNDVLSLTRDYTENKAFQNPDFVPFVRQVASDYQFSYTNPFQISALLEVYEDTEKRAFLLKPEVIEFNREEASRLKQPFSGVNFDDFYSLYTHRDLLKLSQMLKEVYGVDSGQSVSERNDVMFSGHAKSIKGLDYLAQIRASGLEVVLSDESNQEFYRYLHDTFGVGLNREELLLFGMLVQRDRFREEIESDAFGEFVKALKKEFSGYRVTIENLSEINDAKNHADFFDVARRLFTAYPELKGQMKGDYGQLELIVDLSANPPLLEKILSDEFRALVLSLQQGYGYAVTMGDLWAIYQLMQHNIPVAELFAPDFDRFLSATLSVTVKALPLGTLIQIHEIYQNPLDRDLLLSEDFNTIRYRLTAGGKSAFPVYHLKDVLILLKHPEQSETVIKQLADMGVGTSPLFRSLGGDLQADIALSTLPSLIYMTGNPKAEAAKTTLHKYFRFTDHVNDGFVYEQLTTRYTAAQLEKRCKERAGLLKDTGDLCLNDIYYALMSDAFDGNRGHLTSALSGAFAGDIHRTDHNFYSYDSYNNLSRFNLAELNKMGDLAGALGKNDELRKIIGQGIREDIETAIDTELGGIVNGSGAKMEIAYLSPETSYFNGAYTPTQETIDQLTTSAVFFHQHAASYDSADYASPSGSLFQEGADITFAKTYAVDGIVITSIREGAFAVHFYNERGDVAFLGAFDY